MELRLKLGEQEFAIEHTIIEPFENNIKAALTVVEIRQYLVQSLTGQLPGPMYYVLQVPKDVSLPRGEVKRVRALKKVAEWIHSSTQIMYERNILLFYYRLSWHPNQLYCFPDDSVKDELSCINVQSNCWVAEWVEVGRNGFVQTVLDYPKTWKATGRNGSVELLLTSSRSWQSVVLMEHEPSWS